ncbi:hypothetical protein NQE45_26560, partial [Escherichia coli]|nr:hypothetical protein [Escherichia coli]
GTVCVVGKMRDLILQLSKSSIYSTKPLKGLNTYLSTRIRHGTLESTITSSLVSNGFMPADDNDEDRQFYNLLKDTDLLPVD